MPSHLPPHATHPEPIVVFESIDKSFFGVGVLKDVSFSVLPARITGLVGENGAGKSTLMNLLGGNLQPDAGHLRVAGKPYSPRTPNDARASGIAFVHQELNLFPNLSIAENMHLTHFPRIGASRGTAESAERRGWPWVHRRRLHARTSELLQQVGLDQPPDLPVERLSAGERQLVEIAKALATQARVIILDEPTTSLSVRECERLFGLMTRLREQGLSMIYISHALGDVLRWCDDLVVLRDGTVVGTGRSAEFTHDRLVSLMVGRPLHQLYPERTPRTTGSPSTGAASPPKTSAPTPVDDIRPSALPIPDPSRAALPDQTRAPLLVVRALTQPGIIREVSFRLDAGEILGVAGLMGAGRSELARILFGLDPCASGEILLNGRPLTGRPRERIHRGLAFLTEDRRQEGLCLEASIADNLSLVALPAMSRTPLRWLDPEAIDTQVRQVREAVRLSPQAADAQPVRTLSGGNQQKVVLGKWLVAKPSVLILDEPTRGIDVGARFEIYQLIVRLAQDGAGVVVISSEIEELIGICDRILVMRQGEITAEFPRETFEREQILSAALHASKA